MERSYGFSSRRLATIPALVMLTVAGVSFVIDDAMAESAASSTVPADDRSPSEVTSTTLEAAFTASTPTTAHPVVPAAERASQGTSGAAVVSASAPERSTPKAPSHLSDTAQRVWDAFIDLGVAEASNAVRIAFCESTWNAGAVHRNTDTTDYGVFQLNDGGTLQMLFEQLVGYTPNERQAREAAMWITWNIKAARALYEQRGWAPWACGAATGITDGLWSRVPGPTWGHPVGS